MTGIGRVASPVFIQGPQEVAAPAPAAPSWAAIRKKVIAAITTGRFTGLTRAEDMLVGKAPRPYKEVSAQSPQDVQRNGPGNKHSWSVVAAPDGRIFFRSAVDAASYNYWRKLVPTA